MTCVCERDCEFMRDSVCLVVLNVHVCVCTYILRGIPFDMIRMHLRIVPEPIAEALLRHGTKKQLRRQVTYEDIYARWSSTE